MEQQQQYWQELSEMQARRIESLTKEVSSLTHQAVTRERRCDDTIRVLNQRIDYLEERVRYLQAPIDVSGLKMCATAEGDTAVVGVIKADK